MASASRALTAYRRLLRASQELFRGDELALCEARAKLRSEFKANAAETDAAVLDRLHADCKDLEDFLRQNVVQGKLNDRGNYEVVLKPSQATDKCAEAIRPLDDQSA